MAILAFDSRPSMMDIDAVFRPSGEVGADYLLAMKLLASRVARDDDDIRTLCSVLGVTTVEQGLNVLDQFYPGRPIEAKVRFLLAELLQGPSGEST